MNRIAVIAITLFVLAGCASGETAESAKSTGSASESTDPSSTSAAPSADAPTDSPTDAWAGEVLPDSTWTRSVTLRQAKKVAVPQAEIPPNFGRDGVMPMTFVFEDDAWAIIITNDQGREETGDIGTFVYDDRGRLVTTSASEGAAGVVIVLEWEVAGDTLTIKPTESTGGPLGDLILSGQWERAS
jgi:hypothetical protein